MKKYYAIGAVAALGLLSGGAQAEVTAAPVVAESSHPAAKAQRAQMLETIGTMDALVTLLKGVRDKASADAAAEPLSLLLYKMKIQVAEGLALEEKYPDWIGSAADAALEAEFKPIVDRILDEMEREFQRIGAAKFYRSEAFIQACLLLGDI